jgi:membrane protein implicated in regulation of membrane protease activity
MPWWGWIIVGAILLGSELTFVDAQFYLVFLGAAALIVGFTEYAYPILPWLQWLIFGVLSIATLVAFRRRLYQSLRRNLPVMDSGPAGDVVVVPLLLPPQETCRLEYRGTTWTATNSGTELIDAGANARIIGTDGVTLKIIRA